MWLEEGCGFPACAASAAPCLGMQCLFKAYPFGPSLNVCDFTRRARYSASTIVLLLEKAGKER
jgi:hypothetical protein